MSVLLEKLETERYDALTGTAAVITADSKPVWGYFGFGDSWSTKDFIAWHKALKAKYGADKAQQTFAHEWENRPFTSAFGTAWQNSMADPEWLNYFRAEGFTWGTSGNIIVSSTKVAQSTVKAVENVAKAVENVSESASNFGKYALYFFIVVALVAGGYILVKYPHKLKLA